MSEEKKWDYPICIFCHKIIDPNKGTAIEGPNKEVVFSHYGHAGVPWPTPEDDEADQPVEEGARR